MSLLTQVLLLISNQVDYFLVALNEVLTLTLRQRIYAAASSFDCLARAHECGVSLKDTSNK